MKRSIPALTMALLLVVAPAGAFDAQGADIIGLRLGIPRAEATAILRRQGFSVTPNDDSLTARTRDGDLTIDLKDGRVREIRYVFNARGAGEPDRIPASVLDRFGQPNQSEPMTWCQVGARGGKCLDGAAALIFVPETLTLVLRAGTPVQR